MNAQNKQTTTNNKIRLKSNTNAMNVKTNHKLLNILFYFLFR